MSGKKITSIVAGLLIATLSCSAFAETIGTAFTYQGQLKQNGIPVNSLADFQLTLWDAETGGSSLGDPVISSGVSVSNGLFTLSADFGANLPAHQAVWIEIKTRVPAGSGTYTTLTPRQRVSPAPIAMALPGLQTEQNSTSPNILGGWEQNSAAEGVVGAVISGGGSPLISGNPRPNRATDNYCTVSGGSGNRAGDNDADPSDADHATVSGGYANVAEGNVSVVGGGWYNRATGERSTVSGGWNNLSSAHAATVCGGRDNQASGSRSIVVGGASNQASGELSLAAGYRAQANHIGTFVWADSMGSEFSSTGNNQLIVRATGGVGIGTNSPRYQLDVTGGSVGLRIDESGDPSTAGILIDASEDELHFFGGGKKLFEGSGRVGIQTNDPQSELDVDGTATMTGFKLTSSPCVDCVLTCGPDGEGTWQSPGGFSLPYTGVAFNFGPAFDLSNTLSSGMRVLGIDTGIYGKATGTMGTNDSYGLFGDNDQPGSPNPGQTIACGVYGRANASSALAFGVRGLHTSSGNYGYLGGNSYGVYGQNTSSGSHGAMGIPDGGVYGLDGASYSYGYLGHDGCGVWGLGFSGGTGVYGESSERGIHGRASSSTGYGVYGETVHTGDHVDAAGVYGVHSESNSHGKLGGEYWGVYGQSTGYGLWGQSFTGRGVYGQAESGKGVFGESTGGTGVYGYTHTGYGVYAEAYDQAGVGLYAKGSGSGYAAVFDGAIQLTGGSDLSERFDVHGAGENARPAPGMVVSIDPTRPGDLIVSTQAHDRKVAGIISGAGGIKTGMLMGQPGSKADGEVAIALTGRVYCYVDASFGAVQPGDMLTTSATPGHAMKVIDHARAQGAIIGKAMTPLAEGQGLVLVLVNLQ